MGCANKPTIKAEIKSEIVAKGNSNETRKAWVVVGPSGVGKDTLMEKLIQRHSQSFRKFVTTTTRAMRPGEVQDQNYHFISVQEFEEWKQNDGFIESNFYNNNYYGSTKKELESAKDFNQILYLIIDVNGATNINKLKIPANFIAFLPPSVDTLVKRLEGRGTEARDVIDGRIKIAKEELETINNSSFFNYKIINEDLEKAVNELEEKMKILYPDLIG